MSKATLVESVMSILTTGEAPEPSPESVLPDNPNHSITEVRLGGNKEIWAEVRRRLAEIENDLLAELRERKRALEEEERAEIATYEAGDRDIEAMMADGLSREQIIEARSTASVALEMAQLKQREIDAVDDEIEKTRKAWIRNRERATTVLHNLEVSTRAWLLDLVSGSNVHRLNPDRPARQYGHLLHAEKVAIDVLGEELGSRAVRQLGTFQAPDNVWDTVWLLMTERNRKEHYEDMTPDIVLGRLDNAITTTEEGTDDE